MADGTAIWLLCCCSFSIASLLLGAQSVNVIFKEHEFLRTGKAHVILKANQEIIATTTFKTKC